MTLRTLCPVVVLTFAIGMYAQSGSAGAGAGRPGPGTAQNQQTMSSSQGQAQTPTIARIVDTEIGIIEREFVSAAEGNAGREIQFHPGIAEPAGQRL